MVSLSPWFLRPSPPGSGLHAEQIRAMALETPSSLPFLPQRLQDAYVSLPGAGSREQFYAASAVKHLFHLNALQTPSGSFTNALLQGLLTCILGDDDDSRREWNFRLFWSGWEAGLSRREIQRWFSILGQETALVGLEGRRQAILLQRSGLTARFWDLADESPDLEIPSYAGLRELARKIDGTVHTGYLRDARLARKMAGVLDETRLGTLRTLPSFTRRDWNDPEAFRQFLAGIESPQMRNLLSDWGHFEVRIRQGADFDREVGRPSDPARPIVAYFRQSPSSHERDIIWLRAFRTRHPTREGVVQRIAALVHEWEHWRHFSREREIPAVPTREERIVSEMMSFLEEHRLLVSLGFHHYDSLAQWLGVSLGLFLRDFSDWAAHRDP